EIPAEIAACIGVQLAAALGAAHTHGIVHRDVKPENVLLHEQRSLKLTDFGIADMLDPTMSAMTATGQLLGSPAHRAPEQVESGDADARSDVFALGTILYWLTTGVLPFSGKNPHQVLKRVVDCAPIDPITLRPSMGRPLRAVIMRCLSKSPADRFQSAAELASALESVLKAAGVDDPRQALEAYLHDPRGEAPRIRARVLTALLADARGAVGARDRMRALELLDRVLALDDGNTEALKLVTQLDRAVRMRFVVRAACATLATLALAGAWVLNAPKSGAISTKTVSEQTAVEPSYRPETSSAPPSAPATAVEEPETPPQATQQGPATRPGLSGRTKMASAVQAVASARVRDNKPRRVVFDPSPANVAISVDGAEPRHYGPSFRMVELSPGPHRFSFIGAHDCCKPLSIEREIPPGPGEMVVSAKLEFRDGYVYVDSVPADVSIDDDLVKGRSLFMLAVPVKQRLIERHRISVTAPGYEPYTGNVEVRAGVVTPHPVSLKPRVPH
ncbi:MAG: Serine/threonine protein kinase PrkC, regulator of stationary phase, partial [Myxococcaceae bacterium]|nr:Serine/threonine protein kinase PrkC, regulator of stationary phase [Myxococcaceae bacterium]